MKLEIRRPRSSEDFGQIAALDSLINGRAITVENLIDDDAKTNPASDSQRIVGILGSDVVCAGHLHHSIWSRPGVYSASVHVYPSFRRRGFGGLIWRELYGIAAETGVREMTGSVREHDLGSLRFAEDAGFAETSRSFESVLDLKSFDPERFQPWINVPTTTFFSFAETPMGEFEERQLWDLNVKISAQVPGNDPEHVPSFETFRQAVIKATWFDPSGQLFAADGDRWVGISAVGMVTGGEYYNLFTGVCEAYRGRGIAKALKVMATSYTASSGAVRIRTHNDTRNAPMVAINRKLGYVEQPGWIRLTRRRSMRVSSGS